MNELSLFSDSMNGAQSTDMEQSVKALSSSNNLNNVEVEVCDDNEFGDIDLDDFKHDYRTGDPALYVGSYRKYNEGLLDGCWISLAKCADYDEFMRVCRCLHRDEEDPELMFQDADNLPECWYCESGIDQETFDLIKAYAELDEDERRAYEAYLDLRCESDVTVEDFREHYCGEWHSEEEFTEQLVDDQGILDEVPEHLRRFFDMEAYADELFRYDYEFCENFVFRMT